MPIRKAEAEWKGNFIEGAGRLRLGSGAFEGPYSFKSRIEEGQPILRNSSVPLMQVASPWP
jgi:osmotically inducible protein OsmC